MIADGTELMVTEERRLVKAMSMYADRDSFRAGEHNPATKSAQTAITFCQRLRK
jgi:hypothetical protein